MFNLYTNDLPAIQGQKFIYADDICLATQAQYFSELECSLSSVSHYCRQWRFKPSAAKTVASAFHLNNVSAHRKLQVCLNGQHLMHDPYPKYLGVTPDRTLSFREHLVKTASKLKNRNNLLMKLGGSSWGANAEAWNPAIICIGFMLRSCRVLCPCLVPLSSRKPGRCTAELHHATHFWYFTL